MKLYFILCALLGCSPKKMTHTSYIPAQYPNIDTIPAAKKEDWLRLYFSTMTPIEKKTDWSILLDERYDSIRTEPLISLMNNEPDPISITGLLAHPVITNTQRCVIAFYAAKNGIPYNQSLLPKKLNNIHEKLYCSLSFAQSHADNTPLLYLLSDAELPLEQSFYKTLILLNFEKDRLAKVLEEKLRGEEDSFSYLSLYCSWFLIDPHRILSPITDYLLSASEDDRLEAMEFLWGKKAALPIFKALSNSESYSGVFAQLGVTASGGDNIDFTLMYINEGATWDLRLLGIEAIGMWYAKNKRHKKRKRARKELLSLIETENDEVYIHLLRSLRMSEIRESITLILDKKSKNPIVQMEQANTIRILTTQMEE